MKREAVLNTALGLALPIALLALDLRLVISRAYLSAWQAWSPSVAQAERYFASDVWMDLATPSTLFIGRRAPSSVLQQLQHAGEALYTPAEVEHLADVQQVMLRILLLGSLAGAFIAIRWLVAKRGNNLSAWAHALERGGRWMLGGILLLGLGIVLAWEAMFTGMHRIFFDAGTWQFTAESHLIQLFPGGFWYDTALLLSALLILQALCIIVFARWLRS